MDYYNRNGRGSVHVSQSSPCTRCGHVHLQGQCRALNALCFNCSRVGHFKVVCWFEGNTHKSAKSKQRDAERMQTLIFKKTSEVLPFWDVPNDELCSFFPKNMGMVKQYHVKLQKAYVASLCDKEEYVKVMTNLQVKLEDAQNQLSREQRRRHDAEQQIHRGELQLERVKDRLTLCEQQKTEAEIQSSKLVQIDQDQKSKISQLESKMFDLENKIRTMELEIKSLTFQRNEIYYFNSKALNYAFDARERYKAVKEELVHVLNTLYKMTASAVRPRRNFECGRCGSSSFHEHPKCMSQGKTCAICGKSNHFAAACRKILEPIEADSSVLDILRRLDETLPPRK